MKALVVQLREIYGSLVIFDLYDLQIQGVDLLHKSVFDVLTRLSLAPVIVCSFDEGTLTVSAPLLTRRTELFQEVVLSYKSDLGFLILVEGND